MRWLVRLLLVLVIGLPLVLGALVLLAIERTPLVAAKVAFTPANIEHAKRLLKRNDPRQMRSGVLRTITISQEDLDLAVNYLAGRYARGSTSIVLQQGAATARATFELPANPIGAYLNLDVAFTETSRLPQVAELRIGRLPVPAFLCNWLVRQGIARLQSSADYSAAADVVKQVSAAGGMLKVIFEWNDALPAQLKAALVPTEEQARWQAYQARLVELTARQPGSRRHISMQELLVPLLQLAQQRAASGSAAAENRSLLVVLAFYVNGKGLAALVPKARDWPAPEPRVVTLDGRQDFPQHFTISAVLAALAGSPLADAVGLYKEVDDSRGGSGFSFNDIAADRAGTRFGELAGASDAGAARLYRELARGLQETDLLPEVRDLPEFMPEAEFKRRYGGIGQPAYLKMMAEIERRIAALRLYR